MGFIRNALIGVALYEAVRYFLKTGEPEYAGFAQIEPQSRRLIREEEVDVVKGARQTGHLEQMQLNAKAKREAPGTSGGLAPEYDACKKPGDDLSIGDNPEADLTGAGEEKDQNDSWKNSLADDELRAPDS